MKRKIIKYFQHINALTNQPMKYAEVEVINEPVKVKGMIIKHNNIYDVPATEVNDPEKYEAPLDDPDYNSQAIFQIYRKRKGLMNPQQIKKLRLQYHLTLREMAALLGISFATLSNLESGRAVQSILQNNILEMLSKRNNLIFLAKKRNKFLNSDSSEQINLKRLNNKIAKIAKA